MTRATSGHIQLVLSAHFLAKSHRQAAVRHAAGGVRWKEGDFHTVVAAEDQAVPASKRYDDMPPASPGSQHSGNASSRD